jgi:protein gp37
MPAKSAIEWTESTWNPVTGCDKISPGCKYCYAERMSKRLKAMGQPNYASGFKLTLHPRVLEYPLNNKRPMTIFVNSMSDLFHKGIPFEYIEKVFTVMEQTPQHKYQVLTKRSERLAEVSDLLHWSDNVWMGVTVENADYQFRIDHLRECGAKIKFLSLEPLLGPLPNLDLTGIDWVIVGGESGPGARPMKEEWVLEIRNQCVEARVPFFFKQWGGVFKKRAGRLLDGRTWDQMPLVEHKGAYVS